MNFETVRFGSIDVSDEQVLTFEDGIPGFTDSRKFILLDLETYHPFMLLQSLDEPSLTFILADPYQHFNDYPEINQIMEANTGLKLEELRAGLGEKRSSVLVRVVVTVDQNEITANLLAPIVIDLTSQAAEQVILSNYPGLETRHPLATRAHQTTEGVE